MKLPVKLPMKFPVKFLKILCAVSGTIVGVNMGFQIFMTLWSRIYLKIKFAPKGKKDTAIAIIGGSDGPTAIYLTGKLNKSLLFIDLLPYVAFCVSTFLLAVNKIVKKFQYE